jgi:hypothetical protein
MLIIFWNQLLILFQPENVFPESGNDDESCDSDGDTEEIYSKNDSDASKLSIMEIMMGQPPLSLTGLHRRR